LSTTSTVVNELQVVQGILKGF